MLLRTEPGLVPVGAAAGAHDGDGLGLCRRLRARVVLYAADADPTLGLLARVAGADGLVDKSAEPAELFEAIRMVARGGSPLPALDAAELDAAAHRIEPEDLALLAMLVDRTPAEDVAETLNVDLRRMTRRIERLLGRLRTRPAAATAA